ncbi:MAG: dihydroorotate dehydrogenase-like protein [Trueperaceae bacterium]|nr:dihydroorotate dehydrogenase-like protein [Trueperaceae bacterium]
MASASPLTKEPDGFRRLEDGGAAAIVMHSLFEEEIQGEQDAFDHYLAYGTESFAEALDYVPTPQRSPGPEGYLELLRGAKEAVDVPVIASLNGATPGGWTRYATLLEEAGADALELNVFFLPTDPDVTGTEIEDRTASVLRDVRELVSIPVAVKVSPYWSATMRMADRLADAGADALVLFNRFYQPDIDLDALEVRPRLALSTPEEARLGVRWIGLLHGLVPADLALTSGVHDAQTALKGIAAGASVTMLTSEILRNGPERFAAIEADMRAWLEDNEYVSAAQLRGSMSRKGMRDEEAFTRANYKATLDSWHPASPPSRTGVAG